MKVLNHGVVLVLAFCEFVPEWIPVSFGARFPCAAAHLISVQHCGAEINIHLTAENRTAYDSQAQENPNTESFEQLVERAQAAMEAERLAEAIRLYSHATELRPDWSEGWWRLGTLLFDERRFGEARDAFSHFVLIERKQPGPGFAMLGLSEFQLKHYPKALAAIERSRRLGLGTDQDFIHSVLFHDGMLNARLGNPEIALERLTLVANQIAAAHPESPKETVLEDTKLLDAFGIAALRIPKLPFELTAEQIPVARQAGKAQALIALQDSVAAETEFKRLLALYPSEPGVNYFYGVFLLKEHPSLAVDELRRELEVTPSHDAARIQLALEFLRIAEYKQGLKYAKEAVALAPGNFVAHVACGRLWLAIGNTDRSLQELRSAVKLAPGSPDAHFALSQALSEAGRVGEAARERKEFERLKALNDSAER